MSCAQELDRLLDEHPDTKLPREAVLASASKLAEIVRQITGAYVTDLLERNAGPNGALHPLIEMQISHHLDAPISNHDSEENEEQVYRRWLAHREGSIDDSARERFTTRWKNRINQET
jgi:hypothetical protein